MNACPTPETIARYRSGTLNDTEEIRAFDEHLRDCPTCRKSLRQQTAYAAIHLADSITPQPDEPLHPADAQMLAYVRGQSDDVEREIIAAHLSLCRQCRADVAELTAFHEKMRVSGYGHVEERLTQPTLRERCGTAFHAAFHVLSVRSLQSAFSWWNRLTLGFRLALGLVLGVLTGIFLHGHTGSLNGVESVFLWLLQNLATPFIFVALVRTLMDADVNGRMARRLAYLALSNTIVAVCIGLIVGRVAYLRPDEHLSKPGYDPLLNNLSDQAQRGLLQPLLDNGILVGVLFAIVIGLALRMVRQDAIKAQQKDYLVISLLLASVYRSLTIILDWVISLVPIAVFAVVAHKVGERTWTDIQILVKFSAYVVLALCLQTLFYLLRLWFRAAMPPKQFIRGAWKAVLTAFSTASSAATLPITYTSALEGVGVRERSAGLGVLVGTQLNRDGTALYEAITPVFIARAIGLPLDPMQQLTVLGMAIIASIAAPGVPQAGLITMMIVFKAIHLDPVYIVWLLPLDWLLDRFRTAVNVLGAMTMTCLLDRRNIPYDSEEHEDTLEPEILN